MSIQYVDPSTERSTPPSLLQPNTIERYAETKQKNMEKDMDEGDLL